MKQTIYYWVPPDWLTRRTNHFLRTSDHRIPDHVWEVHSVRCPCDTCTDFYTDADELPTECWVTGDKLVVAL